ncbi:TPA: hypothetical protein PTV44_001035 [Clostridium botulinum]|uniref:hypothetical protein n=1 Tax=Clostridium TaxID=1485 RepID=UPI0022376081|nr:hypothetical protein [Clostridium sporogenes]MCW6074478.1 hypothetical protein [Clostridium sporogenes]HDK7167201.1 hypothetical protein [Clostridium botulinum]
MVKQFIKGSKYVFSTKKFKNDTGETNNWINDINDMKVKIIDSDFAEVGRLDYLVMPEWCKCIENNQGRL